MKSKSVFKSLPQEDQQRIIDLCNQNTYDEAVLILARPRPEGPQLQTSHSALCRFYSSYNQDAHKTDILRQCAASLQFSRQAGDGSLRAGVVTLLESFIFEGLRQGRSVSDLKAEFAALKDFHKGFLAEEKWRRDPAAQPAQELQKHLALTGRDKHYDFVPVDLAGQPTEVPPLSPDELASLADLDDTGGKSEDPKAALAILDEVIATHGPESATFRARVLGISYNVVCERVLAYQEQLRARGLTAAEAALEARNARLKAQLAQSTKTEPAHAPSTAPTPQPPSPASQSPGGKQVEFPTSNGQKTLESPHSPRNPT